MNDQNNFRFDVDRFELEIDMPPPTREDILISFVWIAGIAAAVLFVILCLRLIERAGG